MLQYLYNETEQAAEEIVEAVAPELDEVSKEEVAEAAADQAEAIADSVAETATAEGGEFSEEQYNAVLSTCAQVIYTEVMAQLACQQACYAMEDLFTEEAVEEFYAAQEAEQEQYALDLKGHFGRHGKKYAIGGASVVGAAGGAVIGKKIAAKKGISKKKGAIIGALVGGAALGGATAGGSALYKKFKKPAAK